MTQQLNSEAIRKNNQFAQKSQKFAKKAQVLNAVMMPVKLAKTPKQAGSKKQHMRGLNHTYNVPQDSMPPGEEWIGSDGNDFDMMGFE